MGTACRADALRSYASVHPHARGDRCNSESDRSTTHGSPPRPWGPRLDLRLEVIDFRFTPTPVGTAQEATHGLGRRSVHPHARGDRGKPAARTSRYSGSPPRPWGPPSRGTSVSRARRFTPTPVGTARASRSEPTPRSVHPHARGDRRGSGNQMAPGFGSPPRPWGPQRAAAERRQGRRFTPTPVGTARQPSLLQPAPPVHPHARGDRASPKFSCPWGPPLDAYKTLASRPRRAVHPHARGDRRSMPTRRFPHARDPPLPEPPVHPHARGDRFAGVRSVADRWRFTPTPVGTAQRQRGAARALPVHPHARGDRVAVTSRDDRQPPRPWGPPDGSPPRPWGPHFRKARSAGKTC